jgi:hypothetical protein
MSKTPSNVLLYMQLFSAISHTSRRNAQLALSSFATLDNVLSCMSSAFNSLDFIIMAGGAPALDADAITLL